MTSGGARPGAGRKAIPQEKRRVQIILTVDPETRDLWREYRKRRGAAALREVETFIKNLCHLWKK